MPLSSCWGSSSSSGLALSVLQFLSVPQPLCPASFREYSICPIESGVLIPQGKREPSRPPQSTLPLHCVFQHGHLTPRHLASNPPLVPQALRQASHLSLMSHKAIRPLLNCRASFWLVFGYNEPILIALDSIQSHASTPLYHFLCLDCPLKGRQFLPNCLENSYSSCKPNVDVSFEGKPSWIMCSFLHR